MSEARDDARIEAARLRAVVEAVQALHYEGSYACCVEDCDSWPCNTARALALSGEV